MDNHSPKLVTGYKKCEHDGAAPVKIGGYDVWLASSTYLKQEVISDMDYLLPLNGTIPYNSYFGQRLNIIQCELVDRGGVPSNWEEFIKAFAKAIESGSKVAAWCTGSHGRTGCFGASLIAVMEPEIEDPIEEIRKRHCKEAVESLAQAKAIYALKGVPLPEKYIKELDYKPLTYSGQGSFGWDSKNKTYKIDQLDKYKYIIPEDGIMVDDEQRIIQHYEWCHCSACISWETLDDHHRTDLPNEQDCCCRECVLKNKKAALADARINPTKYHRYDCDCYRCKKEREIEKAQEAIDVTDQAEVECYGWDNGCICKSCVAFVSNRLEEAHDSHSITDGELKADSAKGGSVN